MADSLVSNGENDITCELQLMQASAEEEKELDWSISGISAASGYDPYQLHSEVSSSCCDSPEKKSIKNKPDNIFVQQSIRNDLQKLAGSVKDLELNLVGISKMSVSPRTEANMFYSYGIVELSESEKTLRNRSHSIDVTPPVRDTGPGSHNENSKILPLNNRSQTVQLTKLDKMKSTLQHLEEARQKYSSSKIPRRSLSFAEIPPMKNQTSKLNEIQGSEKNSVRTGTIDGSSSSPTMLSSDPEKTVIEIKNTTENDLQKKLAEEKLKTKTLETAIFDMKNKLSSKENEVSELRRSSGQKEKLLLELKEKWSECASNWNQQLREFQAELSNLRLEKQAAQEQFLICEEELGKALQLASDFKHKIDEEEVLKQDILTQLLSEKASKTNIQNTEKERWKIIEDENATLKEELTHLRSIHTELKTANQNLEKNAATEKAKNNEASLLQEKNKKLEAIIIKLQTELKATQSSLHAFYGSQIETIMVEKIQELQSNVAEWEKSLNLEKQQEADALRKKHSEQLETLTRKYSHNLAELTNKCQSLEASLGAVRTEADALRDQLRLQKLAVPNIQSPSLDHPNNELDWSAILMQQNIPRLHNNLGPSLVPKNPSVGLSSDDEKRATRQGQVNRYRPASVTTNSHLPLMNNQKIDRHPRVASAVPMSKGRHNSSFQDIKENSHDASSSFMSVSEKRDIVTSFIRQFLLDHPESVLDQSFLASLNTMAMKLIQDSAYPIPSDCESAPDFKAASYDGPTDVKNRTEFEKKRVDKRPVWK